MDHPFLSLSLSLSLTFTVVTVFIDKCICYLFCAVPLNYLTCNFMCTRPVTQFLLEASVETLYFELYMSQPSTFLEL
jgi:hypothetical protein